MLNCEESEGKWDCTPLAMSCWPHSDGSIYSVHCVSGTSVFQHQNNLKPDTVITVLLQCLWGTERVWIYVSSHWQSWDSSRDSGIPELVIYPQCCQVPGLPSNIFLEPQWGRWSCISHSKQVRAEWEVGSPLDWAHFSRCLDVNMFPGTLLSHSLSWHEGNYFLIWKTSLPFSRPFILSHALPICLMVWNSWVRYS